MKSIMYGIYSTLIQVIYTFGRKLCAIYHDPSLGGYPDILIKMSLMAKMHKSEKGHNSVKYSQNFTES